MKPEELKFFGTDNREFILDRGSQKLFSSNKRYNRYKPGHPAGFIEAFANLYSDLAEDYSSFKLNKRKNKYTFNFEDSEKNAKFFVASQKSNSKGVWKKI